MTLRLRRGTDAERQSIVFDEGELVFVTDTKQLYAGDGFTLGGILVSNIASPSELTQDLDLNGFDIIGPGTISATAFIGDGSGLTNIPGGEGVIPGSNYKINIVGEDSTVILDSSNNTLTGIFIGDGAGLANLDFNQISDVSIFAPVEGEVLTYVGGNWINTSPSGTGVVEGSNYRINIVGDDSTLLLDTTTNTFSGTVVGDVKGSVFSEDSTVIVDSITGNINTSTIITNGNQLIVDNNVDSTSTNLKILSDKRRSIIKLTRSDTLSDLSGTGIQYGSLMFEREDINGDRAVSIISGGSDFITLGVDDGTNTYPESNFFTILSSGNYGIGSNTPSAKLEIKDGSLRFNESRLIDSITPTLYELTVNISNNKLTMYDGVEWREFLTSSILSNATDLPGALVLGKITDIEKNAFGSDSVDVTGAMIYNSTIDRFEFFQAGSWVPLANQELEETSNVRFASVTADSFIGTGSGTPTLESATNLDLQAGNAVRVVGSPFRLANLTTAERDALIAANGDLIYNTTANRIQAYQNGAWINLDDGTVA